MGFVTASEVTDEDMELDQIVCEVAISSTAISNYYQFLQRKREGLAALGEWKHLNCLRPYARDSIHDDILRKVSSLAEAIPTHQPNDLLSSINLDSIQAMEPASIQDVPGGTVSYLFEKCSMVNLE